MPDEQFDEYADQFLIGIGAYGASLIFQRTSAAPTAQGEPSETISIGTIRMSLEHLKSMVFILKRQVDDLESSQGIDVRLPQRTLNEMQIAPEDWDSFWGDGA